MQRRSSRPLPFPKPAEPDTSTVPSYPGYRFPREIIAHCDADRALPGAHGGSAVVLRPDCHHRHDAGCVLRRRDDELSVLRGIRIFDYARFAEPLRERIRARAQQACTEAGIEIEYINKPHIRKEEVVAKVLARRGRSCGTGARDLGDGGLPEGTVKLRT